MRRLYIIIIIIASLLTAVFIWWMNNRKSILRHKLQDTMIRKTDSLYRVTYDSSSFDEISGDASFYNFRIFVDSSKFSRLLLTDTVPGVIIDVVIKSIHIKGLQSLDLLSGNSIDVHSIMLNDPFITLTKLHNAKEKKVEISDTSEIYKRILGNYTYIRSDSIVVKNGNLTFNDPAVPRRFNSYGINTVIKNFLVDSLHAYNNVAAFFLKNTAMVIDSVKIISADPNKQSAIRKIIYDSDKKILYCNYLQTGGQTINSMRFEGLNTNEFVYNKAFYSRKLTVDNVALTVKKKKAGDDKANSISLVIENIFSAITLDTFTVENARLQFSDKKNKLHQLDDMAVSFYNIAIDSGGLSMDKLSNTSFTVFQATYNSPGAAGSYVWKLKNLVYQAPTQLLAIEKLELAPLDPNYKRPHAAIKQKDFFDLKAWQVRAYRCNIPNLISTQVIKADSVDLNFAIKIYRDRTLPFDSTSKVGKYPHEMIRKLKMGLQVPMVRIRNSAVSYEERSAQSNMTGKLSFTGINGSISNLDNQSPSKKAIEVNAGAALMDHGHLQTKWILPLKTNNGSFTITGSLKNFPITALNPVFNPLMMVNIKSGAISDLAFEINGNDYNSKGWVSLLYSDLKIEALKQETPGQQLSKKGLSSLIANVLIKNNNSDPKQVNYTFTRDIYKSFFNLVWKSVFEGAKNTVLKTK